MWTQWRRPMTSQVGIDVTDERLAYEPFERLWTPHRMAYIEGENKPADGAAGHGCPFCRIPTLGDAEGLLLHRGRRVFAVLNLYPTTPAI